MKKIISILIMIALFACSENNKNNDGELNLLRTELDSLKSLRTEKTSTSNGQILTFLTFQENNAEEAMNFYVGLFDNSRIIDVQRYGKDGPAKEGSIMVATFELHGSRFACSDSYIKHEWDFTPGVSIWIECKTDDELEVFFTKLSEKGNVMMPIDNYGFSSKFAFVEDRFGVSWQLNLN